MKAGTRVYNIQLQIDSQLEHVRLLSSAVRGVGNELSLPEQQLGQLELLLVEAVNNVIEHAYEFKTGNEVRVRLECEPDDTVRLVISDQGKSLSNLDEVLDSREFPDPMSLPEGGWGLGLITMLADSCHYERDGKFNHLHVSKRLT